LLPDLDFSAKTVKLPALARRAVLGL